MDEEITFGSIVKERRSALGLTQAELARRVGCAAITIRKIEADALRPSVQIAQHLARALDIPAEEQHAFIRLARAERAPSPIPSPPPIPTEIGQSDLSGRAVRGYHLGQRIGAGGYGAVYCAVQSTVEREVAVKIILPRYANHPDFIRRFESEAQLVARLEHPYIVPLYDYWREPEAAYLVMRYLRGGSLEDQTKKGPLALETVVRLLEQIGAALHTAHRAGVIHRDIKPANVLLDEDANAYLADFGIAKNLNLEDQTQAGEVIGSPAYLSPEQIKAEPIKPQTDIYCLGIMLYELLTGHKPFQGPTPVAFLQQHLDEPLPNLAEVNPDMPEVLDPVIRRATAKNPTDRYPDVISLLDAFRQAIALPAETSAGLAITRRNGANLENPYKGLRAFGEADAPDFFGRDTLVQALLARMSETGDLSRFLAVVGGSGSGKSSVVKAGLMPILRQGGLPCSENWFIVEMMPGSHPLEELEAALLRIAVNPPESLLTQLREDERGLLRAIRRILPPDPATELVMVIDQFEEIFTLCDDETTRAHLLDSLVTAILDPRSRLRVIITLRADFTDRPLQYVDFGELVRQRTEFVLPLTPDELEEVILKPAERTGLTVEPGLAETIMTDLNDQPGTLPLLQYTLTELFEQRVGRVLTLGTYQASGGVRGALTARADDLYTDLDETGLQAARWLFLRLITPGEFTGDGFTAPDTRRRVLRSELTSLTTDGGPQTADRGNSNEAVVGSRWSAVVDRVIDQFGRHRLLTFDRDPVTRGPTVEVAHESLIREWGRLREWLDEDREFLLWQQRLRAALHQWQASEQDEGALLRGAPLTEAEIWFSQRQKDLTEAEQTFIQAGLDLRERRATEREQQRQRELEAAQKLAETERQRAEEQTQAATRLRQRAILLTGALLIAGILAVFAVIFGRQAEQRAREALEAYSLSLAANAQQAMNINDTATGLALALAANRIEDPPLASQRTLLDSAYAPGPRRRFEVADMFEGVEGPPLSLAISPDGQNALTGLFDGSIILWNLETGAEIRRFIGHAPGEHYSIKAAFSGVNDLAFSPDDKIALSGGHDAIVIMWDVATGQEIRRFEGHSGAVRTVAFSPDGLTALSGGVSGEELRVPGELILWDVETGREIRRFEGYTEVVMDAAFAPDGKTVIASSGEVDYLDDASEGVQMFSLFVWDIETGEVVHSIEGLSRYIPAVAVSPDSSTALTASADHNVYLWDLKTGEQAATLEGHSVLVKAVAFSPDGRRAISGAGDGELILWDMERRKPLTHFKIHDAEVNDLAFTPDGHTALSIATDGSIILWDLINAAELDRFEGHTAAVMDVAFHPDGKHILSSAGASDPGEGIALDNSLRLWNLETGRALRSMEGHTHTIFQFAVSPDGETALSASLDGSARLWDLETGREIHRFEGHPLTNVALTPDGRRGLSGSPDSSLILWDVETGREIYNFTGHKGGIWGLAISPDGRTAASAADDSVVILWDLETGQEIGRLETGLNGASGLAFSPDGRRIMFGAPNGTLIEWNVGTGQEINRIEGHSGSGVDGRTRATYLPDGKTVLTSGWDGTLALWDLETGREIRRLKGHDTDFIFDIAVNADGRTALSGATDRAIIQWDLNTPTPDELMTWIETNRYVRELTCDERETYQIEPFCEG